MNLCGMNLDSGTRFLLDIVIWELMMKFSNLALEKKTKNMILSFQVQ